MADFTERKYRSRSLKGVMSKVRKNREVYGMESAGKVKKFKTNKGEKGVEITAHYPFDAQRLDFALNRQLGDKLTSVIGKKEGKKRTAEIYEKGDIGRAYGLKQAHKDSRRKENIEENERRHDWGNGLSTDRRLERRREMAKEAADSTFAFRKGQTQAAKAVEATYRRSKQDPNKVEHRERDNFNKSKKKVGKETVERFKQIHAESLKKKSK